MGSDVTPASARWAARFRVSDPDQQAVISPQGEASYAQLYARIDQLDEALDAHGVRAGHVVALEADFHPTGVALLLALTSRGCVVAPLVASSADAPEKLEIAGVDHVVRASGDGFEVTAWPAPSPKHPLTRSLIDAGEAGLIVFSSGSTGQPKAMLHSFPQLIDKFSLPRRAWRGLGFLLFDHIGGLNSLLHSLFNGGTLITLSARDPDTVCRAIEAHRVELLPTSPTFLKMLLLSGAHERHDLSSLRLVTYGTEVMPDLTLAQLVRVFPEVRFQQTYGLSELGVLRSKSRSSGSAWVRVGGEGVETRVEGGTLRIRTQHRMLGYLNAPSPFDEEGWMDTGDQVLVDGEHLRFLGRATELINVGGEKVLPAEVEGVILELPQVVDVTVWGEANPVTGHVVAAEVVLSSPMDDKELRRLVRGHCRARLERFKVPMLVRQTDHIPHSTRFKKRRPSTGASAP